MENRPIFFTFCSAKKNDALRDSSEEVTPDMLYTSQRVRSFVAASKAKKVLRAILSDEYGVWFPDIEDKWYETRPDDAISDFPRLLSDFDEKMKNFGIIHFCPGVGGPRIHRLYRRLLRESRLKDRIKTTYFMDIA